MGTQAFYLVPSTKSPRNSALGVSLEETQNFESRAWGLRDGKGVGGLSPAPRRAGGRGVTRVARRARNLAPGYMTPKATGRRAWHDAQGYMTRKAT